MRFALVDSNKLEATKGVKGICPSCGSELIAKCGNVKINHWAHKGIRNCDPWWKTKQNGIDHGKAIFLPNGRKTF